MTPTEFATIALALKSAFNVRGFLDTAESINVWNVALSDLDYKQVHDAVMYYIMTEEQIPKPASIRRKIAELSNMNTPNEMQAWGIVSKALRNGLYGSKEEFEKFPEEIKKAVGSPEQLHNWATSDYREIETVIQSNFMRSYRGVCEQQKKLSLLPEIARQRIAKQNEQKLIEKGAMGYATKDERGNN